MKKFDLNSAVAFSSFRRAPRRARKNKDLSHSPDSPSGERFQSMSRLLARHQLPYTYWRHRPPTPPVGELVRIHPRPTRSPTFGELPGGSMCGFAPARRAQLVRMIPWTTTHPPHFHPESSILPNSGLFLRDTVLLKNRVVLGRKEHRLYSIILACRPR